VGVQAVGGLGALAVADVVGEDEEVFLMSSGWPGPKRTLEKRDS
jgi:hypothetical protein